MSPKSLLPESARKRDVAVAYLIQRGLLALRWLTVPLLFGLLIVLVLFSVKLIQELFQLFTKILTLSDSELVIAALKLVDLVLVANLSIMVALAGYEASVTKLVSTADTPTWVGKIDASDIKLKLAASIVAISSIQLLEAFMDINGRSDRALTWMVGIHALFVVAALLLALSDHLIGDGHH